MRRILKNNSIMLKMFIPMLAVMLVQAGLFTGAILWGGTIGQLNQNAYDILNQRVINRKNYLQNDMVQRWSNVGETEQQVNAIVQNKLAEANKSASDITIDDSFSHEIVTALAQPLIYMLRRNQVTGAFVILEGPGTADEEGVITRTGLYLRDMDPSTAPSDNSDLQVERAPSAVSQSLGIPMDTAWKPRFDSPPWEEKAFYGKPMDAARQYPGASYRDLGYWSQPFVLEGDSVEVITYSVPLIDESGQPYGVLGIEITLDYLRKQLPYDELASDKQGSYLLAVRNGEEMAFRNVLATGPVAAILVGEEQETRFSNTATSANIYAIQPSNKSDTPAYGSVCYFQLYNSNAPYEQEQWALIGLMEERSLLQFSHGVRQRVILALTMALSLGVLSVVATSIWFTRPIAALVRQVKDSAPRLPVTLDKTHIAEIDEMAQAVESLSRSVADSASKLSQLIALANVPIGAFEYVLSTGEVDYTEGLFPILDMQEPEGAEGVLPGDVFESLIRHLQGKVESQEEKDLYIFRLEGKNHQARWIRLKVVYEERRILGVFTDVTADMLEKRKIEYERDYDLLTNLLNRRAFHRIMGYKFAHPESLGVGALIMLDLDNLKYINDTYGHDYGDEYIRCAARTLKRYTPRHSVISRMSGDEFYVFLYGYATQAQVRAILEDLKDGMAATVFPLPDNANFRVRASAGFAWFPQDSQDYEELIRYADFAMYKVKNTVKGAFMEFDQESYNRDAYLLQSREALNQLIDGELVEYHFQPIVACSTGRPIAYEALMRSQVPDLKTPTEILTLARSQSKLYQIERLTWFCALAAMARYERQLEGCKLFVNSIPNQTLQADDIQELEDLYSPYLERVVMELTEEEKLEEGFTRIKRDCIHRWHAQLALDDFGAGYNGDSVLLQIMPDYLKVDMSIVRNVDTDPNRQLLLQNVVRYAQEQGVQLIAEGVETQAEMETLVAAGVDFLQGYYLGHPVPVPQGIDPAVTQAILKAYDAHFQQH